MKVIMMTENHKHQPDKALDHAGCAPHHEDLHTAQDQDPVTPGPDLTHEVMKKATKAMKDTNKKTLRKESIH